MTRNRLYIEVDIDAIQVNDLIDQIENYLNKGYHAPQPIINNNFGVPVGKIEIKHEVRRPEL